MSKPRKPSKTFTVQPGDCEDFVLAPVSLINSLRNEIDGLRAQLGLPARVWTAETAAEERDDQLSPETKGSER